MQNQITELVTLEVNYLIFVALVGVLVENAHPGHDLRTEGTSSHLLIVVRMVLVISENFHRWEKIVTTLAIEPKSVITLSVMSQTYLIACNTRETTMCTPNRIFNPLHFISSFLRFNCTLLIFI